MGKRIQWHWCVLYRGLCSKCFRSIWGLPVSIFFFLCQVQVIVCICLYLSLLTSICCCIFFFSACNCWLRSSSSSILASISCRISSSSCFLAAKRTLISSASAYSSVSAWSCSWRRFFSSQSYTDKMDEQWTDERLAWQPLFLASPGVAAGSNTTGSCEEQVAAEGVGAVSALNCSGPLLWAQLWARRKEAPKSSNSF